MSDGWTDQLAGARMQVDQRFQDRVASSQFSNQQWGLIMTAVEFDIDNPEQPGEAELVADTEKLPHIIPELDSLPTGAGMAGPPGGSSSEKSGGLLGKLTGLFSSSDEDSGVDQDQLEAARSLVEEYATELETYLQEQGRWESLCESAAQASE